MSNTFGIKQSFRSQSIARKFARTKSLTPPPSSDEVKTEFNVFENVNNDFASSVLNRKNGQVTITSSMNLNTQNNSLHSSLSSLSNNELQSSTNNNIRGGVVNARLLHMKNYNKAVTRSADHM
jgi:hypothetical protein